MSLQRERWQKIKAKGFWHFALVRGTLIWGGAMTLFIGFVMPQLTGRPSVPLLAAAICLPAGFLWAIATWWASERHYAKHN